MEIFNSEKEKRWSILVFGIYLLLLCWLVLFKFATSFKDIPHLRGINLVPFYYGAENSVHLREVLYNIIVFIPAGFYFTAFMAKGKKGIGVMATLVMSVFFEIVQWIFAIGASDITDIITNTLGGLCGLLLFSFMGKIAGQHRMKIINMIGMVIEALGCIVLALLLAANR